MFLQFNTNIEFRKRTDKEPGEILKIRDAQGNVVETWECVSAGNGYADFVAHGYSSTSSI